MLRKAVADCADAHTAYLRLACVELVSGDTRNNRTRCDPPESHVAYTSIAPVGWRIYLMAATGYKPMHACAKQPDTAPSV